MFALSSEEPRPIFIIEDDVDQLSILAGMLGDEPIPLITAITGSRALEILRTAIPVLVIVDLVLPDIPGSQIVRYIRADERLIHTKVIVITSHSLYVTPSDRKLADAILVKPISRETLLANVHELLELTAAP